MKILYICLVLAFGCRPGTPVTVSVETPKSPQDAAWILTELGAELYQRSGHLPIPVVVWPSAEDWAPFYAMAVRDWNAQVGSKVFLFLGVAPEPVPPAPGLILVLIDDDKRDRADTLLQANTVTGEIFEVAIVMPAGRILNRVAYIMAMHELGHALGLAHDPEIPLSMMHPSIADLRMTLTDADIQRVRDRYGVK